MRDGTSNTYQVEGIGAHVRATMAELAEASLLTLEVVAELSSARYSKTRFNLSHPFLKPVAPHLDLLQQRHDSNGYARYWKQPLAIDGTRFLMCSQWFDWQRTAFDQWVRDLGYSSDQGPSSIFDHEHDQGSAA
jgi:hypothetical protein